MFGSGWAGSVQTPWGVHEREGKKGGLTEGERWPQAWTLQVLWQMAAGVFIVGGLKRLSLLVVNSTSTWTRAEDACAKNTTKMHAPLSYRDDDDDDVTSHGHVVNVAIHNSREPFRYFLKSVNSPPYIRFTIPGIRPCSCCSLYVCTSCRPTQHFVREMTSLPPSWKCDVKSIIRLRQWMRMYPRNNPAKYYPDPTWNDGGTLYFLKRSPPPQKKK